MGSHCEDVREKRAILVQQTNKMQGSFSFPHHANCVYLCVLTSLAARWSPSEPVVVIHHPSKCFKPLTMMHLNSCPPISSLEWNKKNGIKLSNYLISLKQSFDYHILKWDVRNWCISVGENMNKQLKWDFYNGWATLTNIFHYPTTSPHICK